MINCLLCALFASISLQIFTLNYKLAVFSKTLINMPLSVLEVSIPLVGVSGEEKLYFSKSKLESYVDAYFDKNITPLCGQYSLTFYYFSSEDGLYCKNDKCDGVRVTLTSYVLLDIKYEKTMSYYIKNNKGI